MPSRIGGAAFLCLEAEMRSWKILSRKAVFDATPYLSVSVETVELPGGQQVEDYYQIQMRPFAVVVPVMEDGSILVLRQYKHGPRRVSITFPAGYLDPGEEAGQAAQRELMEETGCVADQWQSLGRFVDNGNQGAGEGHYFLATGCRRAGAADAGDLEEMAEEMWRPEDLDATIAQGGFAIAHQVLGWALARMHITG